MVENGEFNSFRGFPEGKIPLTRIPEEFIRKVLPGVNNLLALKFILYFFWRLDRQEGVFRFLTLEHIKNDQDFMNGNHLDIKNREDLMNLLSAIEDSIKSGVILQVKVEPYSDANTIFFVNSARGRAAVKAILSGKWKPSAMHELPDDILQNQSNIYQLYEDNIGPLTPLISDALRDAELTYPENWILEAITIASERNVRNWRYIQVILTRWQEEGRDERKDRPDSEKDYKRYIEGEFSDYIEH
jgi:DNA replication protein